MKSDKEAYFLLYKTSRIFLGTVDITDSNRKLDYQDLTALMSNSANVIYHG